MMVFWVLSVLRDRASDYHNLFLLLTNFYNKPLIRFQLIHLGEIYTRRVLLAPNGMFYRMN